MKMKPAAIAAVVAFGAMLAAPSFGQTKPAESTSKVKKVLLYNKIGGWVHTDGRRDVTAVLTGLSKSKGFALTVLEDDAAITLNFLKTFQAIIWDNNTDGAASLPSPVARQAVIDYVNQGGGWLMIHGAGDHHNSWAGLKDVLGTTFTTHGNQGPADAAIDPAAKAHKELKWMVMGLPEKMRLHDEWYSFQNTVRPLAGVTVVYTAGNSTPLILKPPADGSNDYTYIWARDVGKGRTFYNAIGHGGNELFGQADSAASRLLWQNVRYVAGDFQNGCTNPTARNFDPAARVDDGTCQATGLAAGEKGSSGITLVQGGRRLRLSFPHAGGFSIRLRDARGSEILRRNLPGGTDEVALGSEVKAGVYHLEARSGRNTAFLRMILH